MRTVSSSDIIAKRKKSTMLCIFRVNMVLFCHSYVSVFMCLSSFFDHLFSLYSYSACSL